MQAQVKRQRLARLINSRINKAGLGKWVQSDAEATSYGIHLFVNNSRQIEAVFAAANAKVPGGKFDSAIGVIWWENV